MPGKFAVDTTVSVESSKGEIEKILRRYGASSFASGWDTQQAVIQFDAQGRRIKMILPLPRRDSPDVTHKIDGRSNKPKERTPAQAEAAWEQMCRSAWRSLKLLVQAMLEAVEAEIVTFEEAFMPYTMLPGGQTVYESVGADVAGAIASGRMPPMFELGKGKR